MSYLKITDGAVTQYPYSLSQFRQDNPDTSFPREIGDALLAEWSVYKVTAVPRPASTLTQDAVEQTPQLVNGVWTQVWAMVDVSPEEAAQRAQNVADEAELATTKEDAFVQNFIVMTPAQIQTYINANTGNLTQMRALVSKLALMLLTLAKREYR
jgi:hypothetical protein